MDRQPRGNISVIRQQTVLTHQAGCNDNASFFYVLEVAGSNREQSSSCVVEGFVYITKMISKRIFLLR
jgi:hypothetical protein